MPDITTYLQRVSWMLAAGNAGRRRRGLPADARRVRGLHAGARFGQSGDGGLARPDAGAGDSGRGLQLRFHRRWRDRGKGHHAQDSDRGQRGAHSAGDLPEDRGVRRQGRPRDLHQAAALAGAGTARRRRHAEDSRAFREVPSSPTKRNSADALHAALPADFTVPPDVGVVHRKLPYSDIYFLANTTQSPSERQRRHSACRECRRRGGIRSPARHRRRT